MARQKRVGNKNKQVAQKLIPIQTSNQQSNQNGQKPPPAPQSVPRKKRWVEWVVRWMFFVGCIGISLWWLIKNFGSVQVFVLLGFRRHLLVDQDRLEIAFLSLPANCSYYLIPPLLFLVLGFLGVNSPRKRVITIVILVLFAIHSISSCIVIWNIIIIKPPISSYFWMIFIHALVSLIVLTVILFLFYRPDWSGFYEYIPPSPSKGEYQRGKTLWDWLNLLGVFLVPIVIAAGSVWFSIQINETNIQIAQDQRRAEILKTYMDDITDLYLHEGLKSSKEGDKVRDIATTKTLLALEQLDGGIEGLSEPDGVRKGKLVVFVYKLGLINGQNPVINLAGADLHSASLSTTNLSEANFKGADLSGSYFIHSDLSGALLEDANLKGADLTNATVTNEQLYQVSSLFYTTLPNGSLCTSPIVDCLK